VKKLSLKQILVLHELEIKKHGGSSDVRDMGMLESAINRPFATYGGNDLYPNLFLKCGALIQSIVKNHPFIDGNKRTAFTSAYITLKTNGIEITAESAQVVKFMMSVANRNLSVDEIAKWLKEHSQLL